jgi:hypothetical protein
MKINNSLSSTKATKTFCIILCISDNLDDFDAQIASLALYGDKVFLVISMDCAKDASKSLAKKIVGCHFRDSAVIFIEGPRQGFLANFMFTSRYALSLKSFDFYAFCDQDDVWKDTKLSRVENLLTANSALPELYCSATNLVDKNDTYLGVHKDKSIETFSMALVENISPGNAMVFNKAALQLFANTTEYDILYHDWWIFLLTIEFGKVFFDPIPQVNYRQHSNNTIGAGANYKDKVLSASRRNRYYDSIGRNLDALIRNELPLSPKSKYVLSRFRCIFSSNPLRRIYGLYQSGVKRVSLRDTIFLYLLVLLAPDLSNIKERYGL